MSMDKYKGTLIGKHIWVVQDNAKLRDATARMIEFTGAHVETFADPFKACGHLKDLCARHSSDMPDVIVTDFDFSHGAINGQLPQFVVDDGLGGEGARVLIERARLCSPSVPVILSSGHLVEDIRKAGIRTEEVTIVSCTDPMKLMAELNTKLSPKETARRP